MGAHAPTDIPEAGTTPIVPIPEQQQSRAPALPQQAERSEDNAAPSQDRVTPSDSRFMSGTLPGRVPAVGDPDENGNIDGTYWLPTGYDNLGRNEQSACSTNPYDCSRAQSSPQIANRESQKYFPGPTVDNRSDAARHCIWMASTTEKANSGFAAEIGNAHEMDGGDGNPDSHAMDEHNNQVGRDVGLRHEGDEAGLISECVTLAREAPVVPKPGDGIPGAYDGKLVVIRP
ncbi:DUF6973 domain-containing protein [Gordonia paraffinivorans]|uniref:DUF6973 domain-containing protein n=1 Tax=Gordonia paraffinivorans TaxID=175628 RepID=UPI00144755D2|nr:hypothetical protein [Gordonia paraffinivorans]